MWWWPSVGQWLRTSRSSSESRPTDEERVGLRGSTGSAELPLVLFPSAGTGAGRRPGRPGASHPNCWKQPGRRVPSTRWPSGGRYLLGYLSLRRRPFVLRLSCVTPGPSLGGAVRPSWPVPGSLLGARQSHGGSGGRKGVLERPVLVGRCGFRGHGPTAIGHRVGARLLFLRLVRPGNVHQRTFRDTR